MQFRVFVFLLITPLAAWAQNDQVVYDDARENGWQDYGWATINYANTNPVHSGSDSISVNDPTTNYQALYLHHDVSGFMSRRRMRIQCKCKPFEAGARKQPSSSLA